MTIYRTLLKSKIHRAVVTHADLHYEGSITIDTELLGKSGIREFERVQVVDVENGSRLETYVIAGPCGSGIIKMNDPAARLVSVGDHIIIMAYAQVPEPITVDWQPNILQLNDRNQIKQ